MTNNAKIKTFDRLTEGDTVILQDTQRRTSKAKEKIVTKVGRQYFYIDRLKFSRENGDYQGEFGGYRLWLSWNDRAESQLKQVLAQNICKAVSYPNRLKDCSVDKLKSIAQLLEIDVEALQQEIGSDV